MLYMIWLYLIFTVYLRTYIYIYCLCAYIYIYINCSSGSPFNILPVFISGARCRDSGDLFLRVRHESRDYPKE